MSDDGCRGTATLDTVETPSESIENVLYTWEYVDTTTIFVGSEKKPDQHCEAPHQFSKAAKIFDGPRLEKEDTRRDYGEKRMLALGRSEGRILRVVYTRRASCIHIISARTANTHERAEYIRRIQSF